MKIVLKDNTEIEVAQATYDGHYVVDCANRAAYDAIWDDFTTANLEDFKLVDGNDNVVQRVLIPDPEIIPVWEQPSAGNAYMTGDKVYFPTAEDDVYQSKIDNNVWSPADYPQGWQKLLQE